MHTTGHLQENTSSQEGKRISIAIDGPAGAGKSTLARRVAKELGYLYIDTGAMYRAATWVALKNKVNIADHQTIVRLVNQADIELRPPDESSQGRVRVFVDGDDVSMVIRSRIITKFSSPLSAIAGIRIMLVKRQQAMAAAGGVVMDGRDIGTVVLPNADLKIFLTASAAIRAQRRLKELQELGQLADYETILQEIETRDHLDTTREISPLRQAPDAVPINTDELTIEEVVHKVLGLAKHKIHESVG
jgi:cytidylate kinase